MTVAGAATATVAVIGGSGLYEFASLEGARELRVETPFGPPSDALLVGELGGRSVCFLARHGREHRVIPGQVNYRANVFALKTLGVERIFSASAVGSMREAIRPRDLVIVDQFIDRTQGRAATFFDEGVAAHVSMADPVCPALHARLVAAADGQAPAVHPAGTYVCIEGPAFSTRAESRLYRSWGVEVVGMTNLPEARLAREAEICYATLALVTDYDCWHEDEDDVSVEAVVATLRANSAAAGAVLRRVIEGLPGSRQGCTCATALAGALITPPGAIGAETRRRLAPILSKYLA